MSDKKVLQLASEMSFDLFIDRVQNEYYSHCCQLNRSTAIGIRQTCPVSMNTSVDYSKFVKELTTWNLMLFPQMPPGRLRTAMVHRIRHYPKIGDLPFKSSDLKNIDKYYHDILHQDFFPIYNSFITESSLKDLRTFFAFVDLAKSPLGRLIKPFHYFKVCLALQKHKSAGKIAGELAKAFARPFVGTEEYFTMTHYYNYVVSFKGINEDYSPPQLLAPMPVILFESIDKLTLQQVNMTFRGIILALKHWDESFNLQSAKVKRFIKRALRRLVDSKSQLYKKLLLGSDDGVHVSVSGPLMVGETPYDIVNKISEYCHIPAELSSAHRVSPLSDGPANPSIFMKIITHHHPKRFFRRLHSAHRFLNSVELSLVQFIAKLAYGQEYDDLLSASYVSRVKNSSQDQKIYVSYMLHSLFFHVGCFGELMDDGLRTAYMAVAKMMHPDLWTNLYSATYSMQDESNSNFIRAAQLLQTDDIDALWVMEHVIVVPSNSNDSKPIIDNYSALSTAIVRARISRQLDMNESAYIRITEFIKYTLKAHGRDNAKMLLRAFTGDKRDTISKENEYTVDRKYRVLLETARADIRHLLRSRAVWRFSVQAVEYLWMNGDEHSKKYKLKWSRFAAAKEIATFAKQWLRPEYVKDKMQEKKYECLMECLLIDPFFLQKDFAIIFGDFTLHQIQSFFGDYLRKLYKKGKTDKVDPRIVFLLFPDQQNMERCFQFLLYFLRDKSKVMHQFNCLPCVDKYPDMMALLANLCAEDDNFSSSTS